MMAGFNTTGVLVIELEHKRYIFARTETSLIYNVTDCQPILAGYTYGCSGMLLNAERVSIQFVADLIASADTFTKRRGSSKTGLQSKCKEVYD